MSKWTHASGAGVPLAASNPSARLGKLAAQASDEDHGGPGSVLLRLSGVCVRVTYAQARELHDALRPLVTRCPSSRSFARSFDADLAWRKYCAEFDGNPHDRAVIDFAERWGAEMERRMVAVIGPPSVADVAYDASNVAGGARLTGEQRDLARRLLCRLWTRGDELRAWLDS